MRISDGMICGSKHIKDLEPDEMIFLLQGINSTRDEAYERGDVELLDKLEEMIEVIEKECDKELLNLYILRDNVKNKLEVDKGIDKRLKFIKE